jgi:hypothetical protein
MHARARSSLPRLLAFMALLFGNNNVKRSCTFLTMDRGKTGLTAGCPGNLNVSRVEHGWVTLFSTPVSRIAAMSAVSNSLF